jgi:methylmalonyl-CoA mutase
MEELIAQMSEKAWKEFLDLEDRGSFLDNFRSGYLIQRVEEDRKRTMDAISVRKKVVVGTNMYPNPMDSAFLALNPKMVVPTEDWEGRHASAEVEGFRMRLEKAGRKLKGLMIPLSRGFMTSARMNFTASYLGVAGMELREWEGTPEQKWPEVDCFVICGSDEDYKDQLPAMLKKIKKVSEAKIFLAGDPGSEASSYQEAGLGGWFSARSTVTEDLQRLISLMD